MADTNLMKHCTVLLFMTILGLGKHSIFTLGEVLQKTSMMSPLLISGKNRKRKKLKKLPKIQKREVSGANNEEVTHGGPIFMQGISLLEVWKKNLHLAKNAFFD